MGRMRAMELRGQVRSQVQLGNEVKGTTVIDRRYRLHGRDGYRRQGERRLPFESGQFARRRCVFLAKLWAP